ncbi:hypothetical protein PM082_014007 [Marasmius tenuissimus]|nr:hypothetical protein PM082_014007 [Marasmius tenuissimus]
MTFFTSTVYISIPKSTIICALSHNGFRITRPRSSPWNQSPSAPLSQENQARTVWREICAPASLSDCTFYILPINSTKRASRKAPHHYTKHDDTHAHHVVSVRVFEQDTLPVYQSSLALENLIQANKIRSDHTLLNNFGNYDAGGAQGQHVIRVFGWIRRRHKVQRWLRPCNWENTGRRGIYQA